jgi:hypothetical protein
MMEHGYEDPYAHGCRHATGRQLPPSQNAPGREDHDQHCERRKNRFQHDHDNMRPPSACHQQECGSSSPPKYGSKIVNTADENGAARL